MASENELLVSLVDEPREALDVEVKGWLDLSTNDHRALLAKGIIALANHGGGHIIIGYEELADGTFMPSVGHPADLSSWSQDGVQSVISKYIDPAIQCRVSHVTPTDTEKAFPIISVPGRHRVPIRAKSGSPDGKTLVPQKIYIRRAGPSSEEPQTTEEWDRLLGRIVEGRQGELLDAIRGILTGSTTTSEPSVATINRLQNFENECDSRWQELVSTLPLDAPPRMPHGYYDTAIAIDGEFQSPSLSDLKEIIAREVRNHSGWPAFLTIGRSPYSPKPINGSVETWIGPDSDGSFDKPAHHDYWRISPSGLLFTRRGYQEDGGYKGVTPGTTLDITTPTWRIGEAILQASYVARAIGANEAELRIHVRWVGLSGRSLVSIGNPRRWMFEGRRAVQSDYESEASILVSALPVSLPEVVKTLLKPLYELFDFYQLPDSLVEDELAEMQKSR